MPDNVFTGYYYVDYNEHKILKVEQIMIYGETC